MAHRTLAAHHGASARREDGGAEGAVEGRLVYDGEGEEAHELCGRHVGVELSILDAQGEALLERALGGNRGVVDEGAEPAGGHAKITDGDIFVDSHVAAGGRVARQ